MAEFTMTVAGRTGLVRTNFESTIEYCRPYLTAAQPDFYAVITREDMDLEQRLSIEEALREGIRPRTYTGPHLERAALQRKFAEHLLGCGTLLFHGSAVALDGEGYLFTANCGVGKSTHTRLWREVFGSRAVMINDDKPFLRVADGGVLVCGSPWSGKHGLHTNITVPLKGICILERGPQNAIRPISPTEAADMLRRQSAPPLAPDRMPLFDALVDALLQNVPLWRMACTKDPQAALVSHRAMSGGKMGIALFEEIW